MARPCTICNHPNRKAIEEAISKGEPLRSVAARCNVTAMALSRHSKNCTKVIEDKEKGEVITVPDIPPIHSIAQGITVYEDLVTLRDKVLVTLKQAEAEGKEGRYFAMEAMKQLRAIAVDMVKVFEAQKRIEFEYHADDQWDTSKAYRFLSSRYPDVLGEMVEYLRSEAE